MWCITEHEMAVFYSAHEPSKVEEGDSILHPTIRGCKEKYNVEINFLSFTCF